MSTKKLSFLLSLCLLVLTSYIPAWEVTVVGPEGSSHQITRATWVAFAKQYTEEINETDLPLERFLVASGHDVIEELHITDTEGNQHTFMWAEVADNAWWTKRGELEIGTRVLAAARVEAIPPALRARVTASITDLAPTVAAVLGIPAPAQATGHAMDVAPASHVLLLFLDGFGYVRYQEALAVGLIPNLAALGEPQVALTTYPPVTTASSASALTGAPPDIHGVTSRSIRKTDTETLCDVAVAAGKTFIAVEGNALAFNMRNADLTLSGDRDGNGSSDDNVLANALAVLNVQGMDDPLMPDILWVHFHGIDDAGHTYGPGAPEEEAKIREVDTAVGILLQALPSDTLVLIFADHGQHIVNEETQLGNHNHLIERDMFIPIFVVAKK
ncbi:MAG: alkaline phosphatase family protein [Anaerolineae bacterium]|nr:alkaline phosphatase family protein [Anaerolineae bacterium]